MTDTIIIHSLEPFENMFSRGSSTSKKVKRACNEDH